MPTRDDDSLGPESAASIDRAVELEVDALMQALAAAPARARPAAGLVPGTRIADHLRIDRVLGQGGMGVVYLARDLRLDREVAVKLHTSVGTREAFERLEREARAMAQISDPHVAVIHEVGTHDGRLYLAMEYVEGGTARSWLAEAPRSWREIAALYVRAGRGLAASHAARLVHRDFKPDNVLVGRDGRVRVTDFGLVRTVTTALTTVDASSPSIDTPEQPRGDDPLTRTDAVIGTPAYMAPEQLTGDEPGFAADQYALCVSLFEALHGRRPRESLSGRARAVPRWLDRAVARGLALDPAQRWPSVAALVDRIERGMRPWSSRASTLWIGVAATCTVAAVPLWFARAPAPSCDEVGARMAEVWNDGRRGELAEHFERVLHDDGAEAWRQAETAAQSWLDIWIEAATRSCVATRIQGTQTERVFELSMACFEHRLANVDVLLSVLARAGVGELRDAAATLDSVRTASACAQTSYLLAQVAQPEDEANAREVEHVREALRQLRAMLAMNAWQDAVAASEPLREAAERTGYQPLIAEVLLQLSRLPRAQGHADAARRLQHASQLAARRAGDHDLVTESALMLAASAIERSEFDEAHTWIELARIELESGEADPEYEVVLVQHEASLLEAEGHPELAVEACRRALDLLLAVRGEGAMAAHLREDLAIALDAAGRPRESAPMHREAIVALERSRGASAEVLSTAHSNYGLVLGELGRTREAIAEHRTALRMHEDAYGGDSSSAFGPHLNLGIALAGAGEYDEARAELDRALLVARARHEGSDDDDAALALSALGYVASSTGDHIGAIDLQRRALVIHRERLGVEHPTTVIVLGHIGESLLALGRFEEARGQFAEATAMWARNGNSHHADAVIAWAGLAECELELGEPAAALAHAREALDIFSEVGGDPDAHVRAELVLAQAIPASLDAGIRPRHHG